MYGLINSSLSSISEARGALLMDVSITHAKVRPLIRHALRESSRARIDLIQVVFQTALWKIPKDVSRPPMNNHQSVVVDQ